MKMAPGLAVLYLLAACATSPKESAPQGPTAQSTPVYRSAPPQSASLWNQEPQSLFGNRRARNVGDILTVVVSVDDTAEFQNSLERSRTNSDNFSASSLLGVENWAANVLPGGATLDPGVNLARSSDRSGDGSISRQERLTMRLAAQVVEKLPNGHLVIIGTQRIRVNSETRDLRLQGIVRPDDISRENTITHEKVAAADIIYTGRGQIADATRPRWGSKLLDILVPF